MHHLIRIALTAVVYLLFLLHTTGWLRIGVLDTIENFSYDARIRMTMPGTVDDRVVIVDLDETTLAAEGWPLPRNRFADLVDSLFDHYQVLAAGFDVLFAEPSQAPDLELLGRLESSPLGSSEYARRHFPRLRQEADRDGRFADSLSGRPAVLGFVFKRQADDPTTKGVLPAPLFDSATAAASPADYVTATAYTGVIETLRAAAFGGGFIDNPTIDADGVFRRVPLVQKYDGAVYPSLALSLLRLGMGNPEIELVYDAGDGQRTPLNLEALRLVDRTDVPVDEQVAVLVPYRGPQRSFRYVSAVDVLTHKVPVEALSGKLVLVGATAAGLLDLRTTPVGTVFPGVEVHANIVAGILDGNIKHLAPYVRGIEATMLLVIALLLTLAFPRLSPLMGTLLVIGTLLSVLALGLALWTYGDFVVPIGAPIAFTLLTIMLQLTYSYFVESREKREISSRFGQYVPHEIVDELAEHPEFAEMVSDSREMTVLFSDVRSFTTISEGLSPAELTELMNAFLTPLTRVIHEHRGTIDKYMGDAIMAFWGAPLKDEAHARQALVAALAMVRRIEELGPEFTARGWPTLRMGVGLNTGQMSVGNMGSEFRVAYTAMGDAVNLGSRLEGLTKEYGVSIICSETTRRAVEGMAFLELDRVRVKGKKEPVSIYEPLGPVAELPNNLKQELSHYRQALQAFRNQYWDQAEAAFYGLMQSGSGRKIYEIYMSRIAHYRQNPPGADWDGVFTHTTK